MVKTNARIDSREIERFVIVCVPSSCASLHSLIGFRLPWPLHVELLGGFHAYQRCRGRPPFPVLLDEYSENPRFRSDGKLAGVINRLKNSVICRQGDISVYRH